MIKKIPDRKINLVMILCLLIPLESFSAERKIVFLGFFEYEESNNPSFQVWSISEDGGCLKKVTNLKEDIIGLKRINENNVSYITYNLGLYLLDLSTGKSELLLNYETEEKYKGRTTLALSPDLAKIVVSSKTGSGYYLRLTHRTDPNSWVNLVKGNLHCISPLQWNCKSSSVLYFLDDYQEVITSKINKMDIDGKSTLEIFSSKDSLYSYCISGDERIIVINYENKETERSELAVYRNGKLFDVVRSKLSIMDPFLTCNGKTILYVDDIELNSHKLILYDIESKKKRTILKDKGAISSPVILCEK